MSCYSYTDNLRNRILECLNIQQPERCRELTILFDRCNLRELHDIFPYLINSIFGLCDDQQTGWGLRTTTTKNALSYTFETLYNFFAPTGPMLKLCYRLINENFKYEVDLKLIPHRLLEMLQNGQHSRFYADLINIDPFTRLTTGMSLNAFDYYIFHFVAHGMVPLHTKYSLALEVHSEFTNTAYFLLVAHYLATFLPVNVDAIIPPMDLCLLVKTPQPLPKPALQPQPRSPKYLKIPTASLFAENRTSPTSNILPPNANEVSRLASFSGDLVRNNTWRTETILHFFVDIWLRYDVDSAHHLPSSEFIRVVRLLVKYCHAFALSAPFDSTTMLHLRQLAQPMLRARIFPFLRSVIARWPLDSSMSMVLELWYSYIQPWRYAGYNESVKREANAEFPADGRFDIFIAENLFIYTQIFVQVLPRFQRLDFTMLQNCIMLQRLVKVFCQSIPPSVLQETEERHLSCSFALDNSHKLSNSMSNRQNFQPACCDWETYFSSEPYIPMFDITTRLEIDKFMRIVYASQNHIKRELERASLKQNGNSNSNVFFNYLKSIFESYEAGMTDKLKATQKIPEILETCIQSLCIVFDLEKPDASFMSSAYINEDEFSADEETNKEANLDITRISPTKMKSCLDNMLASPSVDPAVLPIQFNECKLLVRFLHQVSCKLNEMFGNEIQMFWERSDLWGKLAHQILLPPMTTSHFEKTRGYSELCEEKLPPRICLRYLGSYRSLGLLIFAMLCGKIFWGAPSFGLLMVLLIAFIYNLIMALLS